MWINNKELPSRSSSCCSYTTVRFGTETTWFVYYQKNNQDDLQYQICFFLSHVKQIKCSHNFGAYFVTRLTRQVSFVEQELPTLPEHLSSPPVFSGGSCYLIFSFICMFCRSLFVLLHFFFWLLCCLSFFDIQILITSLWYLQTLLVTSLIIYMCLGI
jgi:hypothetical protein